MFKKSVYYLRIGLLIVFFFFLFLLLEYVFQSGWQGMFFLLSTFIFIGVMLWSLLSQKKIYQRSLSYNLVIIALICYLGVIVWRINLDPRLQVTELYTLNLEYCQVNFIILGLIMVGIVLNTFVLSLYEEEERI